MKKILYLLLLAVFFTACKNKEADTSCHDCRIFTGDFLFLDDVAVLKGNDFIYKLDIDANVYALQEKVKHIKEEIYEMVDIQLIGVLHKRPNNEESWEEVLQIKEILKISKQASKTDILIQQ